MVDNTVMNEHEKAFRFIEAACSCGCSAKLPKEQFARLCEDIEALTKPEQDICRMGQLRSMDGGVINTSRRQKGKARIKKRTIYCGNHNTTLCQKTYLNIPGIGRSYFENIRNHLLTNKTSITGAW
jgi:hypothetical protein